jgi:hypothetical protein
MGLIAREAMIGALSLLVELVGLEFELSCGGGWLFLFLFLFYFEGNFINRRFGFVIELF